MFCPKCGTANDDGNRFCHQCSAALPTTDASGSMKGAGPVAGSPNAHGAPGGQKRRGNPVKSILLAVVLLVVAFFVFAALSPDSPAPGGADATDAAGASAAADSPAASADSSAAAADSSAAAAESESAQSASDVASSGTTEGQAASDPAGGAAAAASADAGAEVGDVRTLDVFDWNLASDDMKKKIAFACQMYWQVGGITGEPVDIDSGALAKKIDAAMGNQDIVFDVACSLYDIDPAKWQDTAN